MQKKKIIPDVARYSLHAKLKKHGFKVNAYAKTVMVPIGVEPEAKVKGWLSALAGIGYNIQLTIQ